MVNINIADISYLKNKIFLFKDKKLLAEKLLEGLTQPLKLFTKQFEIF